MFQDFNIIATIYIISYVLLWWGAFGYYIFLYACTINRPVGNRRNEITDYPTVSILVPCYNEEGIVKEKFEDLARLIYPREKLEIVFLDGDSTDKTVSKIRELAGNIPYIRVVETHRRGKILQLNHILPDITSDIIVNTDMDGRLERGALLEAVKEFQADPKVGIVGGVVIPQDCLAEDAQYWISQNQIRVLESHFFSSSSVIATFYAFRNGIIGDFPENVVADDVYLPLAASLKGFRSVYSPGIVVFETRAPNSLYDMLRHKFRKANAHLIEMLRFFRQLPRMEHPWKVIFLTRFLQITALPWLMLTFVGLSAYMLGTGLFEVFLGCVGVFIVSAVISKQAVASVRLPVPEYNGSFFLNLKTFSIIFVVLLIVSLSYPFYSQTSSYSRTRAK